MIKVFLVEDEAIIRRSIKNNIPWENEGYEFAGEAGDGELAYPMIMKVKPDIVITDIKMPFMDGLELASIVKKELPNTKIIILSGYDEFDYAKRAISIGVTDYQLKPISSEKLLETVNRVANIIREEQEQQKLLSEYQKENQEKLELDKARLFYALVENSISTAELLEWGRQLNMDFTASYYTVVLLKIISRGQNENTYQKHRVEVESKVEDFLSSIDTIYYFKRWGEGWSLLVRSEEESELGEFLEKLKDFFATLLPEDSTLKYFGGAGSTVHRLRDVRQSFLEANRAFATRFFTEANQIITADEIHKKELLTAEKEDLKKINTANIDRNLLENFLKVGDIDEASGFLDAYFEKVGLGSYNSLMFRQYLMVDMYFCVTKFLEGLGISAQSLTDKFGDVDEIKARVSSIESVCQYLKDLFTEALRLRNNASMDKYSGLLDDAARYVEQNFSNNEISLNTVASQIGISPSYFSTIFRQETGQTFIEYLTGLRMEKAKELLRCTSKKTAEIAYDVGYKDSHYFSYIFKKTQGQTPKDYRNVRKETPGQ
ncbi:response regulator [Blautia schinkii]|nr:response regulator [Blautia schinkii]